MKLAVISDLHLGRGDIGDRFGEHDEQFLKFLNYLESNFEKIILLGDVFETVSGLNLNNHAEELKYSMMAHHKISQKILNRKKYVYINGNHDRIAYKMFSAPHYHFIDVDGLRLMFTHGHVYDFLVKKAHSFAEWIAWTGGWIRRRGMRALFNFFSKIEDKIVFNYDQYTLSGFQLAAYNHAKINNVDIMVTAHTHYGGINSYQDKILMNSGCCMEGTFQFLSIDTKNNFFDFQKNWK